MTKSTFLRCVFNLHLNALDSIPTISPHKELLVFQKYYEMMNEKPLQDSSYAASPPCRCSTVKSYEIMNENPLQDSSTPWGGFHFFDAPIQHLIQKEPYGGY